MSCCRRANLLHPCRRTRPICDGYHFGANVKPRAGNPESSCAISFVDCRRRHGSAQRLPLPHTWKRACNGADVASQIAQTATTGTAGNVEDACWAELESPVPTVRIINIKQAKCLCRRLVSLRKCRLRCSSSPPGRRSSSLCEFISADPSKVADPRQYRRPGTADLGPDFLDKHMQPESALNHNPLQCLDQPPQDRTSRALKRKASQISSIGRSCPQISTISQCAERDVPERWSHSPHALIRWVSRVTKRHCIACVPRHIRRRC